MLEFLTNISSLPGLLKGSTVVLLLVISEVVLWWLRHRISYQYEAEKKNVTNLADIESVSSVYYRKRQTLGIVRASVLLSAILLGALLYDLQTFGVLALALGAIVVVQKENINSLIAYFFVLSNYRVTDDIRVGDTLGEIVRISPLQTILTGKEENGESTGQRISIPNYRLITENVRIQELKSNTYRRIVIRAVYVHNEFGVDFGEFLKRTRAFLDDFLPKRGLDQVGSFRSFAGAQYKMNFDYDEEARIVVRIAFISRPHDVVDRKEQIIEFMEGMRSKRLEFNNAI